jgi:hypothetical protein
MGFGASFLGVQVRSAVPAFVAQLPKQLGNQLEPGNEMISLSSFERHGSGVGRLL